MVQDLVHNLCESLVTNIGNIADTGKRTPPTPITYLTQWQIVGNSEVHTDPYLTSWKVLGNSVVDNNVILSCGDLGQDGKYHVKISNGVNVYDIALTEPLRKANDVADSIEFPSETEGKALVTRPLKSINLYDYINSISRVNTGKTSTYGIYAYLFGVLSDALPPLNNQTPINGLCSAYTVGHRSNTYDPNKRCISIAENKACHIYDPDYNGADDIDAFKAYITEVKPEFIYELKTPTTELVDVPQIAVSPTDTYTSANDTPYSAFTHTKHSEIWSCGEYNAVDGKYHILVQPQGGSIADIALDEPLRKVNDVVDTIEFPSSTEGKALVIRNLGSILMGNKNFSVRDTKYADYKRFMFMSGVKPVSGNNVVANGLCSGYNMITNNQTYNINADGTGTAGIGIDTGGNCYVFDPNYNTASDVNAIKVANANTEFIYELAIPTTELIDAPQIEEAESYSMVISQGAKAVSWSSFETN